MKALHKVNGFAIAAAASAVFLAAPVGVANASGRHHMACAGVNACKGKSSCKSAKNACKGQNSCKGQGIVKMSKHACEQIGGKVIALAVTPMAAPAPAAK